METTASQSSSVASSPIPSVDAPYGDQRDANNVGVLQGGLPLRGLCGRNSRPPRTELADLDQQEVAAVVRSIDKSGATQPAVVPTPTRETVPDCVNRADVSIFREDNLFSCNPEVGGFRDPRSNRRERDARGENDADRDANTWRRVEWIANYRGVQRSLAVRRSKWPRHLRAQRLWPPACRSQPHLLRLREPRPSPPRRQGISRSGSLSDRTPWILISG
jgi:hypothetical protein